jgi:hypothetical protein
MFIPTIGADDIKAAIYGLVYACLFMVNSIANLFLLTISAKCRKSILQDWKRNPWRAGAEAGLGIGGAFFLVYAIGTRVW